jgi:hypothetical protein
MKSTEPVLQGLTIQPMTAVHVNFGAVAGRDNQGFLGEPLIKQIAMRHGQRFRRKGNLFPNRNRGSMMT